MFVKIHSAKHAPDAAFQNIRIDNNVFSAYTAYYAIAIILGKSTDVANNIYIRNNIFQNGASGQFWAIFNDLGTKNSIFIQNNIFYKNGNDNKTRGHSYVSNLVFKNNYFSDPSFVNPKNDFHLKRDSPAINAGRYVGLESDFDHIPVTLRPEIGACEYLVDP